ncbi:hypothetical protein PLESTM_001897000 [Pleodorina starrii]|nr:hypothetical protein PLESTM_001897000 [Pleodorina starrii]
MRRLPALSLSSSPPVISAATPSGIHAGSATVPGSSSFVMVLSVRFGSCLGAWADLFDATAFGISRTEALAL